MKEKKKLYSDQINCCTKQ